MSGIGFWELIVLFVIGLLILGPERLPRVATQIGRWVGRARRTANQLRFQLEREIALADIEKKSPPKKEPTNPPKDSSEAESKPEASEPRTRNASQPEPDMPTSEDSIAGTRPAHDGAEQSAEKKSD